MGILKRGFKKIVTLSLCTALLSTSIITTSVVNVSAAGYDYSEALKNSILFYDANKCGKDVATDNVFSWRSACHTSDGSDVGADLTGGYHDAGDHVKFGLPQAYTASVLGWSLYEYDEVFAATGNKTKMLQQLKYFTDYFIKSHTDANTFYYQIGDGELDHQYWGSPELQTGSRPAKCVANSSKAASDILGETAAALALMYLNYKDVDLTYANKCLKTAKELYSMGTSNKDRGDGQYFYASTSIYDDLSWGAVWLHIATGDNSYLDDAKTFCLNKNSNGDNPLQHKWTMCWDDMYIPVFVKLSELTGDETYKGAVEYNLNYWINTLATTPGGLKYLHYWGCLRYAAASSMIAAIYYKQNPDPKYINMLKTQIDYILGDNPANMSYVVGMGNKWSQHPHHRAAQGGQGYANNANTTPAKYVLLGALIGGPDVSDTFIDSVVEYQYTEVALDYNAGFVGALAAVVKHYGGVSIPTPTKTSSNPTPTPSKVVVGDLNSDGKFNSIDFGLLKAYLLKLSLMPIDLTAADVDGNGSVNSIDFGYMKQRLLGMIPKLPIE